jgi:hypothetical protein
MSVSTVFLNKSRLRYIGTATLLLHDTLSRTITELARSSPVEYTEPNHSMV